MATYEFKGGCSVHVEFQARTVEELKDVCELLKSYQFSFNGGDKGNVNGQDGLTPSSGTFKGYNEKISEQHLDELFALAKKKKKMLKDVVKEQLGKTYLTSLTEHEGILIRETLEQN